MNNREIEILAPKDVGPAATETIDINLSQPLSSIELIWQTTVVTAAAMLAPHVACISRIELVDGSDVLVSLSGEEAQALAFYATGKMPANLISVKATEFMKSVIPIHFGRKLFDRELALDPKRFGNLQLKITHSEAAANASVIVNQLSVRGYVFDKRPVTPLGFLMSKEIKDYTPVASGFEYTKLPADFPYRLLMLRQKSTTIEPNAALGLLKLSIDTDKRIPIEMTGDEILLKIIVPMGAIVERFLGADAVTATDLFGTPTADVQALAEVDADIIAAADDYSQATITNNKYAWSTAVNCLYFSFRAAGFCPHSCLGIPMGDLAEIEDWFDPKGIEDLRLITQGAAAVGTSPKAQIVIQQLRSY